MMSYTVVTVLMANKVLPQRYLAVYSDTFCYLGHAHLLYQWQGS